MKKSIIIIDDEMPSRESLKAFMAWDKTDYYILEEFDNGPEAIAFYRNNKVDIIITDIQMPIMDGLAFIKIIKSINKQQEIIVLSCHEKFSYAREVMRYGVNDYLIKDMLTKEDLLEALNKSKRQHQDFIEEKGFTTSLDVSIDKLLEEDATYDCSPEVVACYHILLVVAFDAPVVSNDTMNCDVDSEGIEKVRNALGVKLGISGNRLAQKGSLEWVLLTEINQVSSQLKYIYDSQNMATRVRKIISEIMLCDFTIGISRGFKGVTDIVSRYEEASEACKYRVFLGENKNIFYNTVFTQMTNFNPNRLDKMIDRAQKYMDEGNLKAMLETVETIYLEDIKGFMQYNYIRYVNARIVSLLVDYIGKNDLSYAWVFGKNFIPLNELEESNTIEEIIAWFSRVIERVVKKDQTEVEMKYSLRVMQTIHLINKHYTEGIQLTDLSQRLGIHKVYLSRIFKEETGKNVTQYIQELKINDVKKMLIGANQSIQEIAETLNYSSSQQLSSVFKKETGMTPKAYKKLMFGKLVKASKLYS
ncbi:response regulator [Petrocella sp. FN5]|uniref:response regulator n=1 Tax=Petrocella sp. FN5 TaxID=3032002 RepID=UPI0023DA48C9|nr:response regulator [Petrocella sp. FN5]MDF1616877.1 response regulator [Petrocella sp. FN5]